MTSLSFDGLRSAKRGQCDFFDIAEQMDIEFERITAKEIASLDYDIYNAHGDPNDDSYQAPESFDEIAVSISGECNAIGSQHMWVFGVNFNQ